MGQIALVSKVSQDKFLKLIGKKIRGYRLEQGISQDQLAFECDMPIKQIGRIERGEINTGIFTLYRITEALEIALTDILDPQAPN